MWTPLLAETNAQSIHSSTGLSMIASHARPVSIITSFIRSALCARHHAPLASLTTLNPIRLSAQVALQITSSKIVFAGRVATGPNTMIPFKRHVVTASILACNALAHLNVFNATLCTQ